MPTIKDVAQAAGVSVGTVSRVLAKNESVKLPLKTRVLEAMEALSYKPNLAARALRTNSIAVIGLILPDITNPFFAQLAKCVEMEVADHGYSVMLANSHECVETERTQLTALLDRAVSGVIIVASSDGDNSYTAPVPIISLDRRFGECPLIATDHFEGSRQIAAHLYALGHRHIAYIAGPQSMETARQRREGFVSQIEELTSLEDPIKLEIYEGQFDYDSGEDMARTIFNNGDKSLRPTAIAAASDQQAIGVLRCARDLNLSIPKELSVTGFDDISLASLVVPRLTTLRQPIERLAKYAVKRVLDGSAEKLDEKLLGDLVERESTARVTSPIT
ncbi:LacI family DNA-binding transcriptional regulator [Flexibacterium corallicola]|uniref:LacI family DNA-binding transcriptional regulator n=1 Tax=Flexibacterium corallicola TaxID=3037259 RepID=UPI00286EF856|nr:LacI family DNA-binding transcriptional regulator [Pseudovibrio sp. M1P-2-3]